MTCLLLWMEFLPSSVLQRLPGAVALQAQRNIPNSVFSVNFPHIRCVFLSFRFFICLEVRVNLEDGPIRDEFP